MQENKWAALLAAVAVVVVLLVLVLLGVRTYQTGAGLDAGWSGVFLLVLGALLGGKTSRDKKAQQDAAQEGEQHETTE